MTSASRLEKRYGDSTVDGTQKLPTLLELIGLLPELTSRIELPNTEKGSRRPSAAPH